MADINWFSSSEPGRWTFVSDETSTFFGIIMTYAFLGFLFFASIAQEGQIFLISLFYVGLLMLTLLIWQIEVAAANNDSSISAVIDFGDVSVWPVALMVGTLIGTATLILLRSTFGIVAPMEIVPTSERAPIALAMVVWFIPIAEEAFFNSVTTAQVSELYGIIPGMFIVISAWIFLHFGVYSSAPIIIGVLIMFRVAVFASTLYLGSSLPGYIAHIIVNTGALMLT